MNVTRISWPQDTGRAAELWPAEPCRDLLTTAAQLTLSVTAADLAAAPLLSPAYPTESAALQSKALQISHAFAELDSICHCCTGLTTSPSSRHPGYKSAGRIRAPLSSPLLRIHPPHHLLLSSRILSTSTLEDLIVEHSAPITNRHGLQRSVCYMPTFC